VQEQIRILVSCLGCAPPKKESKRVHAPDGATVHSPGGAQASGTQGHGTVSPSGGGRIPRDERHTNRTMPWPSSGTIATEFRYPGVFGARILPPRRGLLSGDPLAGGLRPRLMTFAPSGVGFRCAAYFGGASLRKKNLKDAYDPNGVTVRTCAKHNSAIYVSCRSPCPGAFRRLILRSYSCTDSKVDPLLQAALRVELNDAQAPPQAP